MEALEGMTLGELMKRRGPLPVEEALDYVLQACEALEEAHAKGIVHRDLKPENIFLIHRADGTPLVKVIDFGLSSGAELAGADGDSGTSSTKGEIVGSPPYMSPEQVRDFETVDARTDIWSLGAILYELLTGSLIHEAESTGATLTKICHCPVSSLRGRRPDLPPELDRVILRCLERDPDRRVKDVRALAAALLPFAGRAPGPHPK
jgi:serine/threonine protein kinase